MLTVKLFLKVIVFGNVIEIVMKAIYAHNIRARHGPSLLSRNPTFEAFNPTGLSTVKHRLYSHKRSNLVIATIKEALACLVIPFTPVNSGVYASQSDGVPFKSILCCSPVDQHLSNKLSFKSNYFLDEFLWQSGCALTFHISIDAIHGLYNK
uniref:Uncharacterized protein n=1 Tax=Glossina austeni TaxID=7395 RepID=A0A1A9UTE5_GLOAU